MASCPFKILSVPKTATLNEIKTAYRRLALQLHPDTNGGDPIKSEKFKAVSSAYNILSNPVERRKYEQNQQQWPGMHNYGGRGGPNGFHYQPQAGDNFNEEEWLAYHFGIDDEDFDFFGPETIIFDAATQKTRRTSRKQNGSKKSEQVHRRVEDSFQEFTPEEIENIIRHSARAQQSPMSQKGPKGSRNNFSRDSRAGDDVRGGGQRRGGNPSSGGGGRGGKGNRGGKKKGQNGDMDCVVS